MSAPGGPQVWTMEAGARLVLVVNMMGQKRWRVGKEGVAVAPMSVAAGVVSQESVLEGLAVQRHDALVLALGAGWLKDCFGGPLKSVVPAWLPAWGASTILTTPLEQEEMGLAQQLDATPSGRLRPAWLEAKLRCLLCSIFHREPVAANDEFFCLRYHRVCDDRVERTQAWLLEHLDVELDLKALARDVGCSQFYLSRIFSERTGQTIRQCHRRLRMEAAARLLTEGRLNVSEVAVEVGYRSLSHFTKAFTEQIGCLPSEFSRQRSS